LRCGSGKLAGTMSRDGVEGRKFRDTAKVTVDISKEEPDEMLKGCVAEIEGRHRERLEVLERRIVKMEAAHSSPVQALASRLTKLGG